MLKTEEYNQPVLVPPGHMDDRNRSDVHMKSSKTEDMHNSSVQAISHPIPVGCSLGSTLEPIQQGQELSVGSLTSSPVHINSPLPVSSNHNNPTEQGSKFTVQTYNSPNHHHQQTTATAQFKIETCCPCRMLNTDGQSLQHQQHHQQLQQQQQQRYNNSHETTHTSSKIPITNTTTGTRVKIAEFHSHSLNIHGQSDSNNNNTNHITINKDSITSKSNWARGLFERLRAASLTTSTIDTKLLHSPYATVGHNDSTQRYKEYYAYPHLHPHQNAVHLTPDYIDPKRLPKAHGPLSNCLEFSKKPLQKSNNNNHLQLHSNTKPIPVSSTHIDFTNTMNLSTSSSSSSNTRRRRIRWFSHSTSCDPGPGDPLLSSSNHHAHLSSSAAEEIQGAVNILAGRQVFPSAGSSCTRPGIRVKSASESQHLLVISKSLSNSKEDFSPCAFGQFDENRVYTTLFRHSTCYDVLPDSGKLVIVDSRLPTLRAISALLDNGVIAAPVWCSETQSYLGVFSQELALDMLGHLHYSEVNTSDGIVDGQSSSSATPSSPTSPTLSSFNASLFRWGSKQLGDVLNLMYGLSDGRQLTDLFVHPQYCLQKALYRLFHHPEQHNANKANQYNNRQHQTLLKFKLSNASGHRASYPNNSPKAFLEETVGGGGGGGGGGRFARQSSTFFPSNHSNHSSSAVSISEGGNDSASSPPPLVKLNSPFHQQSAVAVAATAGTTPPTNSTDRNKVEDPSSSSSDNIQRVSSKCCAHSNPSSLYTSLLSYLLVIDNHSGNALGLLGSDRLLAYLRLRVDELPSTGRMIMPIGSVHGLRWAERYPGKSEVYSSYLSPSPNKASTILNNDHLTQLKEVPVLHLTDRVSDALQVFMCWLPQLPCLPVIHFVDNDQLRPIDFIGLISPGDLLNFIMCSTPDTALDEPISKIMEKKSLHCAAQQNCVCFVTETLAIVLDRMFRLKAPCLIMFDTRKSSASCAIATKPFGQPVGMVTAKDILHSVILGHRHRHHHHHHRQESGQQQHSSQPENINQIPSGVDVSIPHNVNHSSRSNNNIYKSSGSFESGIHSSSCQDGREFIRGDLSSNNHNNNSNGNTERVHFVDIDENKKRSPSPLSVCSLSSTGTFSASSPESDVEQSLANEHFKSACNNNNNINNNVRSSVDCNCSCHRYDNGNNNNKDPIIHQQQQPMTSLSSSSGGRQSHPLKDPRDSTIGSGSTGLVDKIASRFLPHNLIHNSGWSSDRRSSEPYTTTTKKDKMKRKMHILDNQRRPSPQIAKQSTTTAQYHHQQQQHHVHYAESSHCVYPVSSLVAIDEMMMVGSGGVTSTSATTTCTTNTTNSTVSSNISSTQVNTTVPNATDHHMLPASSREEDDAVFPMD
ncbi:unnamed protein product [Trichobilharzia szidati]|nr:unnamed protein product [Trichobilharzia szidati]